MARSLLEAIEAYKSQNGQRTFWLVDIALKADGIYPTQDFHFSTQAVEANTFNYEPLLKSKPSVKFPLNATADGGSVKIDNTDFSFGQVVVPKDRFVQDSKVKIWFGWKIDGVVYTDPVFDGELQNANLSTADNAVTLSLVGDLYKPSLVLGGYPLTQRCIHIFNVGGLLSPDESPCGWQVIMGGNPDACDHTEDGPNGCAAHFNLHRIGAIPFFANVQIKIVQSSQESSGFEDVGRYKNYQEIEPTYPDNIYY